MSKIFVLIFVSLSSLIALDFYAYDEALLLQKQNGKTIMIDVTRTDCRYCTDMEQNVFTDESMSEYLSKKFIPVKLNLDYDKLPLGIKVHFTPTFFFVDTEQKIIKTIPGSWSVEDFRELTKNIP